MDRTAAIIIRSSGIKRRLDTLQAAILLAKLDAFDSEVRCAHTRSRLQRDQLRDLVKTPYVELHNTSVYAQYTVQVEDRENFLKRLQADGIPTAVHYPVPLHAASPRLPSPGADAEAFPRRNRPPNMLSVSPCIPTLSKRTSRKVIAAVRACAPGINLDQFRPVTVSFFACSKRDGAFSHLRMRLIGSFPVGLSTQARRSAGGFEIFALMREG